MSNIPQIYLLFGFLGAGKTTLVRNLLDSADLDIPTAVIVNEFGSVGIDGEILQGKSIDTIELASGCICCTLRGSLLNAIEELAHDKGARRIVVEATGVADPEDMLDDLEDPSIRVKFDVAPIVTVVDSANFEKIRSMLGEFYESQVINADIVILNKIDLGTTEGLESVAREVKSLNDQAEIRFAEHCDIESSLIFSERTTAQFAQYDAHEHSHHHEHNHDHAHIHAHDHAHESMTSLVFQPRRDLSKYEFERFCGELPDRVWRMKGYMLLDEQPVLIHYSAGSLDITDSQSRDNYRMVVIGEELDECQLELGLGRTIAAAVA
ncbi:MAG: GTP-binding protein [Acidiferrobacterales bacterium]|nr:GTP-binding protein [Acidiferrobacterales bacterium]